MYEKVVKEAHCINKAMTGLHRLVKMDFCHLIEVPDLLDPCMIWRGVGFCHFNMLIPAATLSLLKYRGNGFQSTSAYCIIATRACLLKVVFSVHTFFFVCSIPDIGDKYSVFRQLEQPAEKKPVGKKLSHPFLHIQVDLCLSSVPPVRSPDTRHVGLGWDRRNLQKLHHILLRKQIFVNLVVIWRKENVPLIKRCFITWVKPSGHYNAILSLFHVYTVPCFASLQCSYQCVSRPCFIRTVSDGDSSYNSSKSCFAVTFLWHCQAPSP